MHGFPESLRNSLQEIKTGDDLFFATELTSALLCSLFLAILQGKTSKSPSNPFHDNKNPFPSTAQSSRYGQFLVRKMCVDPSVCPVFGSTTANVVGHLKGKEGRTKSPRSKEGSNACDIADLTLAPARDAFLMLLPSFLEG